MDLSLLKEFIIKPISIGALFPSSDALCAEMVAEGNIAMAETIVELGPGTGVITRHLLEAKSPGARLLAVELNGNLYRQLRRKMPALELINDDAVNLKDLLKKRGINQADAIISGLPWASFPPKIQQAILDAVMKSLSPNGYFITFAYLQGKVLPSYHRFRAKLYEHFSSVEISQVVWKNIPPAFVYRCQL